MLKTLEVDDRECLEFLANELSIFGLPEQAEKIRLQLLQVIDQPEKVRTLRLNEIESYLLNYTV